MALEASYCPRCGGEVPSGAHFCPRCGLDLRYLRNADDPAPPAPERPGLTHLIHRVSALGVAVMAILLGAMVLTAVWSAGLVLPEIVDFGVHLFIIVPKVLVFLSLYDSAAIFMYLIYIAAAVASFALLLWHSRDSFRKELKGDFSGERSPLYAMATLFFALMCLQMAYYLLILGSVDTYVPPVDEMPFWLQLYLLLEASVWEEVVSRIFYIGLPMMLLASLRGESGAWRRLLGGFEMDKPAVALIFISAAIFAFAHLAGWDVYKLLPTFLVGLAMGYLFVRYGLYASIALHLSFDYLTLPAAALGGTGAMLLTILLVIGFCGLGLPHIYLYAKAGGEFLLGRPLKLSLKKVEPDREGYVQIPELRCPHCGNDGALIQSDGYECLRCRGRF